jgi:two-component system, NarL family, nitrate/nitrite response regulator NarL
LAQRRVGLPAGELCRTAWRIGLVDDHPLVSVAVEQLLDAAEGVIWAGASPTVDALLSDHPDVDVAVLDLRLADGTTPHDNVARLRDNGLKVLIFTSGEHPELLRSAARAGALGIVLKSESPDIILGAIRSVARDEPVVTRQWAAAIDADPNLPAIDLSPQLQRILTRYASGETAAAIAAALGISSDTVNDYLQRIRLKYAEAGRPTRSKLDFMKRAMEDGFVPYPRRQGTRP